MADFNEKAESVIQGAKLQALWRGAFQVEDLDILYSLLGHHEEPIVQSLLDAGLNPPIAWAPTIPDLPWSEKAVEVLNCARKRARFLGSYEAGIKDILSGLIEVNGKAARIIRESEQKMRVHIRPMIRRDMPEVLAIEEESFEFPWLEEDFIRCLRGRNSIGMVAEYCDKVAGFMIYELAKNHINILNFAIAKEWRRRGVGSQMVSKLTGKLSAQRRTRLTLEVRETNLAAQFFFKANGFRAVSVLRNYYDDAEEDAYVMQYRFRQNETMPLFQGVNRISQEVAG